MRITSRHEAILAGIAAALDAEGLRPIVDAELRVVRVECLDCRAGDRDPMRLYRPLLVVPRRDHTTAICEACGVSSDA